MVTYTKATCPECNTTFDRVPVDGDEDGMYAALEVTPCADPECTALLCKCCSVFACFSCAHTFCTAHLVEIPDEAGKPPLACCTACAAIPQEDELPAAIPPQRETRHADTAEVAARCPECLSTDIECVPYDFGMDPETGYHGAGEQFRCRACRAVGDAGDVLVSAPRVLPMPAAREIAAGMAAKAGVA